MSRVQQFLTLLKPSIDPFGIGAMYDDDDLIGPLGRLDDLFGVLDEQPVPWVKFAMGYLVIAWVGIFAISMLFSIVLTADVPAAIIPRVLIAVGCLYRHIDPWILMLPRMITCAFLHYDITHLISNTISLMGAFGMWTSGTWTSDAFGVTPTSFAEIWFFPVWFISSYMGSAASYTATLGKSGSFTVGASGGVCGFNAFILTLMLGSSPAHTEATNNRILMTILMSAIQLIPVTRGGQKTDVGAHGGGALAGLLMGICMNIASTRVSIITLRRMGVLAFIVSAVICVVAFLEVFRQFLAGHSDRVARAYFRWLKLEDNVLRDRSPNEPRRWTIAQIDGIEARININRQDGPRGPKLAELEKRARERDPWKDDEELEAVRRLMEQRRSY